jgi:hypothetical protein
VAGDVTACVGPGYSGLPAEGRNEHVIQIGFTDDCQAIEEQEIGHLAGLGIWQFHSCGPDVLPGRYGFAHKWINWLRECR